MAIHFKWLKQSKRLVELIVVVCTVLGSLFGWLALPSTAFDQQQKWWFTCLATATALLVLGLLLYRNFSWLLTWLSVRLFLYVDLADNGSVVSRLMAGHFETFLNQIDHLANHVPALRQLEVIGDFRSYCDRCKQIIHTTGMMAEPVSVITIQTPVSFDDEQLDIPQSKAYHDYITETINVLITTNVRYHRLVIVRDSDGHYGQRIVSFLKTLITTAVDHEKERPVDLANVYVGFIAESEVAHTFRTNTDCLVTNKQVLTFAFLKEESRGAETGESTAVRFVTSLFVGPRHAASVEELQKWIENTWNAVQHHGHVFCVGNLYSKYLKDNTGSQKTQDEAPAIFAKIESRIKELIGAAQRGDSGPSVYHVGNPDTESSSGLLSDDADSDRGLAALLKHSAPSNYAPRRAQELHLEPSESEHTEKKKRKKRKP